MRSSLPFSLVYHLSFNNIIFIKRKRNENQDDEKFYKNALPLAYSYIRDIIGSNQEKKRKEKKAKDNIYFMGKTKRLPVASTGSRSRTCRSDISLGSFSYISCLRWGSKSTIKINYIQSPKIRKHSSSASSCKLFLIQNNTIYLLPVISITVN
jgi:hypothetical protein